MINLMYVPETPWGNLGTQYEENIDNSVEICKHANLDWAVNAAKMFTSLHTTVPNYHAIYREDTNDILGVVNRLHPDIIQNTDSFHQVEHLIGSSVDIETTGSLNSCKDVFGCFKVRDTFKLLDEDIDQYLVVLNEHLKPDGKVTILYTPIRVVCQNTLSAALHNNVYKVRVPVSTDSGINQTIAERIFEQHKDSLACLEASAKKLYDTKLNTETVGKILDEMYPYMSVDNNSIHAKQNENIEIIRSTFMDSCMEADNLGNFRGTGLQVFHALTDFTQHYFKNVDKAYDLNYRMSMLPGRGVDTETNKVIKFLKIVNTIAA